MEQLESLVKAAVPFLNYAGRLEIDKFGVIGGQNLPCAMTLGELGIRKVDLLRFAAPTSPPSTWSPAIEKIFADLAREGVNVQSAASQVVLYLCQFIMIRFCPHPHPHPKPNSVGSKLDLPQSQCQAGPSQLLFGDA